MAERVHVTRYADVTSFPELREDLAVIVPDTVSAEQVTAVVLRAGRPLLAAAEIFDVYRDAERIGAGNVSLALRLSFRAPTARSPMRRPPASAGRSRPR